MDGQPMERKLADIKIAHDVADIVAQIFSQSFAIYRVDKATAANIRAAHKAASDFFLDQRVAPVGSAERTTFLKERYQRIVNGNLCGYNALLESKELFRAWYHPRSSIRGLVDSCVDTETLWVETPFSRQQPWPSRDLSKHSSCVAKDLHHLLSKCMQGILLGIASSPQGSCDVTSSIEGNRYVEENLLTHVQTETHCSSPPKKRRRMQTCSIPANSAITQKGSTQCTLQDLTRPSSCPLDYFFYHNKNPCATNCSEHVDRGALVVVCLTDVLGLEVFCSSSTRQDSGFRCPEKLVNQYQINKTAGRLGCSDLVCIMAGDQLSALSGIASPRACIHRVRNKLQRARLSISYELRLDCM